MNKVNNSNFVKMVKQGIGGSFFGIISGLILGVAIYFLQFPLLMISGINIPEIMAGDLRGILMWPNAAIPGTLGSCFGAIIGGLFGCILSLKEISKK